MEYFLVEAVDAEGKKIKRVFQLEQEQDIVSILDFLGLSPVKIKKVPKYYKYLNFSKFFQKVRRQELIEILDNLHLIVKSGLPLNQGLIDLAKDAENNLIKDMLYDIAFKIQSGRMLSEAVESYKNIFSPVVVSLFKIGEETGNLEQTLKDASEHLKKIEDLKAKTKQALIYPAFAFFATFGAMIFWMVYVLPKILNAFRDFNVELPITTIILMNISQFLRQYIIFILIFLAVFVFFVFVLRKKSKKFKYLTDKLLLKLPIIGLIISNFNYAFFAEYVRLMLSSGLPLYKALTIIQNSMKNDVFRTAIKNTLEKISIGESLSKSLKEENLFAPLIIRMVAVGEQTGELEEQLKYIADYYYNKVDYISQNIAKMIEPIVIGFVGTFMAIIMVGLMGPIYELISKIGTTR